MTFVWLVVWLFMSTPEVQILDNGSVDLNNWGVALVICFALDLIGGASR